MTCLGLAIGALGCQKKDEATNLRTTTESEVALSKSEPFASKEPANGDDSREKAIPVKEEGQTAIVDGKTVSATGTFGKEQAREQSKLGSESMLDAKELPEGAFVLKDYQSSRISVPSGSKLPPLGAVIYQDPHFPQFAREEGCHSFWLMREGGLVSKFYMCNHPEGNEAAHAKNREKNRSKK